MYLLWKDRVQQLREQGLCITGATAFLMESNVTKPPCFAKGSLPPVTSAGLEFYLKQVFRSITALQLHSENLVQEMMDNYCINPLNTEKENASFWGVNTTNAGMDSVTFLNDFCTNQTSFLRTMRAHYDMLNKLSNYLEQLRMTCIDDFSNRSLASLQKKIFTCMCSIKIALRSRNQDPTSVVPSGDLAHVLKKDRASTISRCDQQTSEYATALESRKIANYLQTVYSTFKTSVSKCM